MNFEDVGPHCRQCWHFLSLSADESSYEGECRLNPPLVVIDAEGNFVFMRPPVDGDDVCGQFKAAN